MASWLVIANAEDFFPVYRYLLSVKFKLPPLFKLFQDAADLCQAYAAGSLSISEFEIVPLLLDEVFRLDEEKVLAEMERSRKVTNLTCMQPAEGLALLFRPQLPRHGAVGCAQAERRRNHRPVPAVRIGRLLAVLGCPGTRGLPHLGLEACLPGLPRAGPAVARLLLPGGVARVLLPPKNQLGVAVEEIRFVLRARGLFEREAALELLLGVLFFDQLLVGNYWAACLQPQEVRHRRNLLCLRVASVARLDVPAVAVVPACAVGQSVRVVGMAGRCVADPPALVDLVLVADAVVRGAVILVRRNLREFGLVRRES